MNQRELTSLLIGKRKKLGLTQLDVVKKSESGITRQYYGMIELGSRSPSVKVAKSIGEVLGVPWTIFFETKSNEKLLSVI
ncbi:helix-turn-helix transcriptional regulator [Kurthia populi]|uniref:Helix-turn-helix transcriptional regulator n=1 Tax=Kurthia populi TaxID=1562132 RepID=A0ABW5XXU9_9BACL